MPYVYILATPFYKSTMSLKLLRHQESNLLLKRKALPCGQCQCYRRFCLCLQNPGFRIAHPFARLNRLTVEVEIILFLLRSLDFTVLDGFSMNLTILWYGLSISFALTSIIRIAITIPRMRP